MDRLSHYTVPAFLRCAIVVICLGTSLAQAETAFIEKAMPAPIVEIAPPPPRVGVAWVPGHWSGAAPNGSGSRAIMSRGSSRPCQRQLSKLSHRHRRLPMSGCADIGDGRGPLELAQRRLVPALILRRPPIAGRGDRRFIATAWNPTAICEFCAQGCP